MKWDQDIMVRAILMIGAGVLALILSGLMSSQFINQALLTGTLLGVGLLLIALGLLAVGVALVKGKDRE